MSSRTVVVGAGLAGLRAAALLQRAGTDVVVLESSDGVGGRVRTDKADGFTLDRGFQVLLTAYPAARAAFDYRRLDLKSFAPGVVVRADEGFHELADPRRSPLRASRALDGAVARPSDIPRLLRLAASVAVPDGQRVAARPQSAIGERLRSYGFSERIIERFFRPFFAGILFDPDLSSSSRMFELIMRSFLRGDVAVPAAGMQALPEELARGLDVRLESSVSRVAPGHVELGSGDVVEADEVIVATDGSTAHRLLGRHVPDVPWRSTVTVYWDAPRAPFERPVLVLDGDWSGPVNNLAVMSSVARTYAPPGRHLVAASLRTSGRASVPDDLGDTDLDERARSQLRAWYGDVVDEWQLLRVDRIGQAQPVQSLDRLQDLARPVRVSPGLVVCGDHRDTSSIQGALVSGRRAAEAVLAVEAGRPSIASAST